MAELLTRRRKIAIAAFLIISIGYVIALYAIHSLPQNEVTRSVGEIDERAVQQILFSDAPSGELKQASPGSDTTFNKAIRELARGGEISESGLASNEVESLFRLQRVLENDQFTNEEVMDLLVQLESGQPPPLDVLSYVILKRSDRLTATFIENNKQYYSGIKNLAVRLSQKNLVGPALDMFDVLSELYNEDFVDPEVVAWKGSTMCKQALYVDSSMEKIEKVNNGVTILDSVVYDYPDYLVARYVRANTYMDLPSIFKKRSLLLDDIDYIVSSFIQDGDVRVVDGFNKVIVKKPDDLTPLKNIIDSTRDLLSYRDGLTEKVESVEGLLD